MPRRKIALVLNTAWNIYNFRWNLVKHLQAQDYELLLLAPTDKYTPKLAALNATFIPIAHLQKNGTNPRADYQLYRELKRIYQKHQPDLIIHFTIKPNIYGGFAATRLGIPYLCTVTGLGHFPLPSKWMNTLVLSLYRRSFTKSETVIFQNPNDRDLFVKMKVVAAQKCQLTPGSGVDTAKFRQHLTEKNDDNSSKITFLMIARLIKQKGVLEYIEAAKSILKIHPNTEFQLLGDTWNHPEAIQKETIENYHKSQIINYLGTTDDVKSIIEAADVIVLPSYYGEGVPRTLLEALAMSKPIVTTDHKGCREVVEPNKNGYLVPIKDADALTDALREIIEIGSEARQKMGEYSRQKALREFDDRIVNDIYLEEIRRILKEKK